MDIQTAKIELVKEILNIDAPELIEKVANLLKKEKKDFWDDLIPYQQEEITKADLEILNEETFDYETLMASHRNRKLNFIKDFINLENEETISKLENILWKNKDFWNELSLSEKEEIQQGIKELDEGKKVSFEDFLSKVS
ncbi:MULTISPECIES: hypothetical protein [unclassified Polaribacter]|uniref:hypothetical protein n=1 Tax=unclassified Polaribacter TaxID=196858 RepID=UPI0011BEB34A|nr:MULTISPECIES: hypothetical protein [unclassified Polaribacter]TXD52500.1 hypothetical protein ES043_08135 [Polaribacter sp. IC063]TXD60486.1 hypothetical protein ES044_07315 [Polaribacter sp. IC066]